MEPYILFALLLIGPVEPLPQHGREITWSAEFTSLGGFDLIKRQLIALGFRPFHARWRFICIPYGTDLGKHPEFDHFLGVTNSFKFVDVLIV